MPASAPAVAPAPSPVPAGRDRREGVVAGAAAFLLLVAWSPAVAAPAFSPRAALLLVVAGAGLPALLVAVGRRRLPETLAAAFAGGAVLSAAAADDTLAWVGPYPLGTGAAFVVALAVVFTLGRRLGPGGRRGAVAGIVAAAALNAVVAFLQVALDLGIAELALIDQRASGLLGNPVFLGGVTAAAFVLASRGRPSGATAALLVVLAAGTQVSGTRIALGLLAVAVVVLAALHRDRWSAVVVAAAVGGVAVGSLLASVGAGADADVESATERLAASAGAASGLGERLEVWEAGVAAFADRPLLGYGPGRFQPATSSRQTLALARDAGPTRVFDDAHNVIVEHLATTGAVGAGLLVAWSVAAARPALRHRRWELLVAAGVLGGFHLLEPQNLAVSPLLALIAGTAGAEPPAEDTPGAEPPAEGTPGAEPVRTARPVSRGLAAVGVAAAVAGAAAGAVLLGGDASARIAALDFDPSAADRAVDLLAPWAAPAALEARIGLFDFRADDDPGGLARALAASDEAVDREPHDPAPWLVRARVLVAADEPAAALAAYRRVLALHPWSVPALVERAALLDAAGHDRAAAACRALAALVDPERAAPIGDGAGGDTAAETRNGSGRSRSRSRCLEVS